MGGRRPKRVLPAGGESQVRLPEEEILSGDTGDESDFMGLGLYSRLKKTAYGKIMKQDRADP